jgi:hypothetical protein
VGRKSQDAITTQITVTGRTEFEDIEGYGVERVRAGLKELGAPPEALEQFESVSQFSPTYSLPSAHAHLDWGLDPEAYWGRVREEQYDQARESWLSGVRKWLDEFWNGYSLEPIDEWKRVEVPIPLLFVDSPPVTGVEVNIGLEQVVTHEGTVDLTVFGSGLGAAVSFKCTIGNKLSCPSGTSQKLISVVEGRARRVALRESGKTIATKVQCELTGEDGLAYIRTHNLDANEAKPEIAGNAKRRIIEVDPGGNVDRTDTYTGTLTGKIVVGVDVWKVKAEMKYTTSLERTVTFEAKLPPGKYTYVWVSDPIGVRFVDWKARAK